MLLREDWPPKRGGVDPIAQTNLTDLTNAFQALFTERKELHDQYHLDSLRINRKIQALVRENQSLISSLAKKGLISSDNYPNRAIWEIIPAEDHNWYLLRDISYGYGLVPKVDPNLTAPKFISFDLDWQTSLDELITEHKLPEPYLDDDMDDYSGINSPTSL
jgi:hypothetical protein